MAGLALLYDDQGRDAEADALDKSIIAAVSNPRREHNAAAESRSRDRLAAISAEPAADEGCRDSGAAVRR